MGRFFVGMSWSIKQSLLDDLLYSAKAVYPNEFIAMVGVTRAQPFVLNECIVLPAEYGRIHSQLRADLIPFDPTIVGTVHSHPSPSSRASAADRNAFARLGKIHLILGYPYDSVSFSAYSSDGKKVPLPIVK